MTNEQQNPEVDEATEQAPTCCPMPAVNTTPELRHEIRRLQLERIDLNSHIARLQVRLDEKCDQIEELTAKVASLNNAITSLTNTLTETNADLAKATEEKTNWRLLKKRYADELSELGAQHSIVRQSLDEVNVLHSKLIDKHYNLQKLYDQRVLLDLIVGAACVGATAVIAKWFL